MIAIEGSGVMAREERDVEGFDSIALSHTGRVILTQGNVESLAVTADDNLLEHVVTEVRGGTLHIGLDRAASMGIFRPTEPLVFEVAFRELSGLSISGSGSYEADGLEAGLLSIAVSGSGDVELAGLVAEGVSIAISGSGDVELEGEADELVVTVSGSGNCRTENLDARIAAVSVSGSGVVILSAEESLDIRISGNGDVGYYGSPSVTRSVSGAGDIEALGSKTEAM
jgi:hypothetical protein